MSGRRLKFWGWGYEDAGPTPEQTEKLARLLQERFGLGAGERTDPPRIEEIRLRPPRVRPPAQLDAVASAHPYDRASHTYGKGFRDVVRALRRDFSPAPDVVVFPKDEEQIDAVLEWASREKLAVIPYGGGSSVVGGVEPRVGDAYAGAVTLDLRRFDRVLEVDRVSRAARIQAGVYGPRLEEQLKPHGLTLRHFPQSFEFSSLGGWIATRSGGHYATLYTHIDEFVESLRVRTPGGAVETRRLPASGAGPDPNRLFIGSEGILGVITEAWMRVQDRPKYRASAAVTFADFADAVEAVRAIAQAGLYPSNCRLLDAGEALVSGAGTGAEHVLVLGFESADHPPDAWMDRALECCRDHGGRVPEGAGKTRTDPEAGREGAAGAWRKAFLEAPYLRDALVCLGMVTETFETAVTWDRFGEFHAGVREAVEDALRRICGSGMVTCRFTHVYPDGPAPYYTVTAPGKKASQLEQWDEIKAAASEAVLRLGGTITHHHAVGRDHRPWYDRERPGVFGEMLKAAKKALDPSGVLNPGVLVDP
ncbi:MAG: alkyldihydroxyacetonephosphate synthase [Candidatus Binatia bacterium]|nr:MAG: alkyldihydroxyacetonephosphate synthase [Candidatus Binatia bacterium]